MVKVTLPKLMQNWLRKTNLSLITFHTDMLIQNKPIACQLEGTTWPIHLTLQKTKLITTGNSEQAMSSLAFETLADRRDKHILKFVKKCIEGKAPQFFSNYFKSNYDISKRIIR